MRYYEVFELFQCGGAIRRNGWEDGKYITLNESKNDDYIVLDQDGCEFDLTKLDLCAKDWEEYIESPIDISKLGDKDYLGYVQTKALSIVQNKSRILNMRLRVFAEKQKCVPEWIVQEGLKYYITYSYVAGTYFVEGTWKHYSPNIVYFTNELVAKTCIQVYKPLMDELRHVENIRGILFNNNEITREEVSEFERILDSL